MNTGIQIVANYYPSIPRTEILQKCKYRYNINDLSTLGSGFAVTASELINAQNSAPTQEGLYRCVIPQGVTGNLAKFKDGSGYTGTVMNEAGIAAQASWYLSKRHNKYCRLTRQH